MSMLELITKASATTDHPTSDSQHPLLLNPNPIFLINSGQKFFKKLKIKLKNPNSFTKVDFISLLNSHLQHISQISRISIPGQPKNEDYTYTNLLIQNLGFLIGDNVLGLVLEACLVFEIWEILETLIVSGLVDGCYNLVDNLIEKNRADLVCLCVKHVSNLKLSDVLSVLKYFLSSSKDAYSAMVGVRKEWERLALSAIETAMDKSVGEKKLTWAKDAAVMFTMAHDEFTSNELCLHYLVSSPNMDDVMFSACIGKLNGLEIMGFVRYLKKWLVKYQKFPQASSSSKAFESVPSLENVTKCFGLVVDEHFSSLVMNPEFREEVESIELVVNSLAAEARLCCNLANLCAGLNH
ncbi:hypothetical protein HanHA300_Chr06g0212641 [Helianthus annuus]|nr:hypothetical protein HanHA300_Chr06g0212641 [Helianthus annuus]KAJ0573582.1 hypothetical protein HanHA89_Chr06g0228341 [Helianthus annuus]